MPGKTKGQFAIEFVSLIAFMFIVFLGFTAMVTSKILDAKENERQQIAEDIAALAKNEIVLAQDVSDGYNRNFTLPNKVNGNAYEISIIGSREIVVRYIDKEYAEFLQKNVVGNLNVGKNTVMKKDGIVYVNS